MIDTSIQDFKLREEAVSNQTERIAMKEESKLQTRGFCHTRGFSYSGRKLSSKKKTGKGR